MTTDPSTSPAGAGHGRHVAAGGWRRGAVGIGMGAALGLLFRLLVVAEDRDR